MYCFVTFFLHHRENVLDNCLVKRKKKFCNMLKMSVIFIKSDNIIFFMHKVSNDISSFF